MPDHCYCDADAEGLGVASAVLVVLCRWLSQVVGAWDSIGQVGLSDVIWLHRWLMCFGVGWRRACPMGCSGGLQRWSSWVGGDGWCSINGGRSRLQSMLTSDDRSPLFLLDNLFLSGCSPASYLCEEWICLLEKFGCSYCCCEPSLSAYVFCLLWFLCSVAGVLGGKHWKVDVDCRLMGVDVEWFDWKSGKRIDRMSQYSAKNGTERERERDKNVWYFLFFFLSFFTCYFS